MTTPSPADEQSIRAIFEALTAAWDRGDARAYAALFTEDSDYVAFDGTRLRGRVANEEAHRVLFSSFLKDTRLVGELDSVRALGPDAALAHGTGAVVMPW
ncbi:MAG: SgcJ/EcaC family oxidoreductase, partial [Nannocystaceae bacterium]